MEEEEYHDDNNSHQAEDRDQLVGDDEDDSSELEAMSPFALPMRGVAVDNLQFQVEDGGREVTFEQSCRKFQQHAQLERKLTETMGKKMQAPVAYSGLGSGNEQRCLQRSRT